jgi:ribonuclease R
MRDAMSNQIRKHYQRKLLEFFESHSGHAFKARALSRELKVPNRDYRRFRELLRGMTEAGQITRYKGNQYGKAVKPILVNGKLQVKTQGYGFLIRDDGREDVFISQKNMGSAIHGDRVQVQVWAHQAGKLPEGQVKNILERKRDRVVGIFLEARAYNYLIPDDFKINRDIYLSPADSARAQPGQKVVAEITDWGDAGRMPSGRVIEILGYPDDPGVDVLSVARGFDLHEQFSPLVEQEVAQVSGNHLEEEVSRRLDLRKGLIFTIDPEDAKDFDDAVSLIQLDGGNYQLGVHIADVSHFVPLGSPTDREALARGMSVYLVDRVVPMLPEKLSNELCSLKPQQDRLCYSVIMELNSAGDVVDYQILETVINSRYRLSYDQVHQLINAEESSGLIRESEPDLKSAGRKPEAVTDLNSLDIGALTELKDKLDQMVRLSQVLQDRWEKEGSIDFDAPEPFVRLDKNGKPVELGIRPRYESHRLIEAFMLLANRTVAEHMQMIREKTGLKLPFIYRVHQKPSPEKLEKFTDFVCAFGYDFSPGKKITPKKFQTFLNSIQDPRHKAVIDEVAVRTMMKAVYSTANTGHFGLAFKMYTHFTSPIRRYPDLMVHRLMKAYQRSEPVKLNGRPTLIQIADQITDREIMAQEAERESIRAKQIDYMYDHLGMEFDGIVSGVTAFGFYVEIPEFMVEGLVSVRDLTDDYYIYDEKRWQLKGESTGRVYRLGDSVQVQIVRIHREMRRLDFILVAEPGPRPKPASKNRRKPYRHH